MDVEIMVPQNELDNPAYLYLIKLRSNITKYNMRISLNIIARKLKNIQDVEGKRPAHDGESDFLLYQWENMTYKETSLIQSWLEAKYKPSSARRMMAAVRGVLKEAKRLKLMNADQYYDCLDLNRIAKNDNEAGRMLQPNEFSKLLKTCSYGPPNRGARDAAIFSLMGGCGLRRAEIIDLKMEYLDLNKWELNILGKGRKKRKIYITNQIRAALEVWLKIRQYKPGPFFYTISISDKISYSPMSIPSMNQLCDSRGLQAKIDHFSPHDLRRTFISNMISISDLSTASALAGHENLNTTLRYDKRGENVRKEAMEKMDIPYTVPEEI